jgi:3-oxoacyl-[acyl-carrier protein] reductase
MNLDLVKKVVLVTASGHGLGKGIAKGFLEEGALVVVTDIDNNRLESTVGEFIQLYGKENIFSFCGDLTIEEQIVNCIAEIVAKFGKLDILIANLGTGKGSQEWNIDNENWNRMMDMNFNAARKTVNAAVQHMPKETGSSITFISSIAGVEVIGAPIHYSVAKAALIAYSTNLSKKLASDNIRVNSVCPGNIYFKEGTWDFKMLENKDKVEEMLEKDVPLKRFTTPEEIANLVLFLSSEKAGFITGSCIISDGGQTVGIQ